MAAFSLSPKKGAEEGSLLESTYHRPDSTGLTLRSYKSHWQSPEIRAWRNGERDKRVKGVVVFFQYFPTVYIAGEYLLKRRDTPEPIKKMQTPSNPFLPPTVCCDAKNQSPATLTNSVPAPSPYPPLPRAASSLSRGMCIKKRPS